jgi:hypothetical protein
LISLQTSAPPSLLLRAAKDMSFRLTIEYNQEKGLSEPSTNTITLEVSRLHRVSEISTKIFKDVQSDLRCTEDTYCLYWPLSKMWLTNNRPIGQILKGFMSANLQYRQKCRPFKIRSVGWYISTH